MKHPKENCALKLDDIVKTYGTGENAVQALKGISLKFRESEFVSVLGPSGCGKTTLLNIIGGLDRYNSGDLNIKGVSTKGFKDSDWDTYRNRSIGFVFQSYNLIPHQTVISNVELALTLSGITEKERRKRAKQVLKQVGLNGLENKRPNQMSGGQMQRVAIARALINNPEIILADEPTGALDTETSVQIMEILKKISKERLVIMVTHNPDLAEKYSTRIIRLVDGEVEGDTNPLTEQPVAEDAVVPAEKKAAIKSRKDKNKGRSKMKIWTAIALSFSNLKAKKGRTILTSLAGSIGIIGIALVLAVSTGFSSYVKKLQADTLSVYPLTVYESSIDFSDFQNLLFNTVTDDAVRRRVEQKVFSREAFSDLTNMLKSNDINQAYDRWGDGSEVIKYVDYVQNYVDLKNEQAENAKKGWAYALQKSYGFDMNNFMFTEIGHLFNSSSTMSNPAIKYSVMSINDLILGIESLFEDLLNNAGMNITADFVRSYIPTITEIPNNQKLLESQYEIIDEGGRWATEADEIMIVVDKYNRISDITLALLGYRTIENIKLAPSVGVEFGEVDGDVYGTDGYDFDKIKEKPFYYINNSQKYIDNGDNTFTQKMFYESTRSGAYGDETVPTDALKLKITGVVRLKDNVRSGVLATGIAYTSALVNAILSDAANSTAPIVTVAGQAPNNYKVKGPFANTGIGKNYQKAWTVEQLAASTRLTKLSIYSADFAAKEKMKKHLDDWNKKIVVHFDEEAAKAAEVHYSDSTEMLFSALNNIVDAVKIVLIAFTSISLIVSSIMIGIITYVSVVERTKEIGVLRAIGARKKDISRIFNAETFLIGLFAGIFGIVVTYILSIPINSIVGGLISGGGTIASLKIVDALLLVVVSFALTVLAGLLPARIAAKKDPVVALRTE